MPGGEISVPSNPAPSHIKDDWAEMIRSGLLLIGEPCTPYKVLRYATAGGEITEEEIMLNGRKISLLDIRIELLRRQEQFMRMTTIEPETTREVPTQKCHRHLAMWHDHATILNKGLIMVTVHILYDTAIFLSNEEYTLKTGVSVNVQAEVEQPMVYMLTLGSSSIEDQAALISERVDCLSEMSQRIFTSNGR